MIKNVLFLCTGNSCRSQMAQAILNSRSDNKYKAFSAGSSPNKEKFRDTLGVHPKALETIKNKGLSIDNLSSKSWDEYIKIQDSFNFVITLCDDAHNELKNEACPFWPGKSIRAHWGLFDPDKVEGDEDYIKAKFIEAFEIVEKRVDAFLSLDTDNMDDKDIMYKLNEIGQIK